MTPVDLDTKWIFFLGRRERVSALEEATNYTEELVKIKAFDAHSRCLTKMVSYFILSIAHLVDDQGIFFSNEYEV